MNLSFLKIAPVGSGLRWLQWVAILIALGVFAVFNLIFGLLTPVADYTPHPGSGLAARPVVPVGVKAEDWINFVAAVLAIVIAPSLLRYFEHMQQQTERQNSELRTQHEIDKAINAQYDLNAILQVAITEATKAMDAEIGAMVLWREGASSEIEERVLFGVSEGMAQALEPVLNDRLRELSRLGTTTRQVDLDQTWQRDRFNSSLKLRNLIFVPIAYQDRPLGLLLLGNRGGALAPGQGFSRDDAALLESIANTVAVAVQNARFVRETRRRGEMLRALVAHTGAAIADESDSPRLMQLFADAAGRILGCGRVAVYALDDAQGLLLPLAAADLRTEGDRAAFARFADQPLPADIVFNRLRLQGRPDLVPRSYAQMQEALSLPSGSGDFLAGPGTAFVLGARNRRALGLLVFGDLPSSQEVADFAVALAAQAGVTLENARLFADLSQHYRREKRIAEKLQENLLPSIPPRVGAFEFAPEYQAALQDAEIGGDFLDLFPLAEGRVGIVMADVSGKGLEAAVQTAAVKYTLRAFAHHAPAAPGSVLSWVNDVLCSEMHAHEGFITLFFGSLDTATGDLVWANAGHEPPVLCRAAEDTVETLDKTDGMVLGCLPGEAYKDQSLILAPGDMLFLYTDGVTEARNEAGEFLGLEGLHRILPPCGQSATTTLSHLYARLHKFSGDIQRDDIAMLLVRHAEENGVDTSSRPES